MQNNESKVDIQPKVTIVTVCYNAEKEIGATITSVQNQTYSNIEYIVIDGNSSDNTVGIIKKHEPSITKWLSEPDKGIFDAMNKGLRMANGEWVLFLNAGDSLYEKTVIERMVVDIPSNVGVLYGNAMFVKGDENVLYRPQPFFSSQHYYPDMGICHQAIMVRADIAKNLLFDLSFKLSADFDMIMKIYKQDIGFCYKDIIVCNYDLTGVSTQKYLAKFKEKMRIYGNPRDLFAFCLYVKAIYVQMKINIRNRL